MATQYRLQSTIVLYYCDPQNGTPDSGNPHVWQGARHQVLCPTTACLGDIESFHRNVIPKSSKTSEGCYSPLEEVEYPIYPIFCLPKGDYES